MPTTTAGPSAPPPRRTRQQKQDSAAGLLLLLLLLLFWVALLTVKMRQQQRWLEQRFLEQAKTLKAELPPLFFVGEEFAKAQAEEYRKRLEHLEARTRNLERRMERVAPKQ